MTERKQTFIWLDFLRFTTAICVLLFHYEMRVRGELSGGWFQHFGRGVDFFFILSGFVIAHNYSDKICSISDYVAFLRKRLARIYPLHLLTLLIVVGMYGAAVAFGVRIKNTDPYDFSYLIEQLTMTHAWGPSSKLTFNTQSWSISAEWFCYLFFPLLAAASFKCTKAISFFIFAVALIALQIVYPGWIDESSHFGIVRAVPEFVLGILLWRVWRDYEGTRIAWDIAIITYLLAVIGMLFGLRSEVLVPLFGLAILAGSLAETFWPLAVRYGASLEVLGDMSYGVYMWHAIVAQIVFVGIAPRAQFIHPLLWGVIATVGTLAVARYCFLYFEKPARTFLSTSARYSVPPR